VILDHIDSLGLSEEAVRANGNELNCLAYLSQGLQFLDWQVKRIEEKVLEGLDPKLRVVLVGNHPALRAVPQGMVACAFHWYAVSACNYVRLVGWLVNEGDSKKANEYVAHVLPAVRIWRNKVAAHFAKTNPRTEDTAADLAMSVMFPIAFDDDAFYANTFTLAMRRGGQSSSSRADMRWSLTHTHRALRERYWAEGGEAN
jgi:hypothetical protein